MTTGRINQVTAADVEGDDAHQTRPSLRSGRARLFFFFGSFRKRDANKRRPPSRGTEIEGRPVKSFIASPARLLPRRDGADTVGAGKPSRVRSTASRPMDGARAAAHDRHFLFALLREKDATSKKHCARPESRKGRVCRRRRHRSNPPLLLLRRRRATMQTGQVGQCTAVEDSRHPNEATGTPPSWTGKGLFE